jgi:hypothetical protein
MLWDLTREFPGRWIGRDGPIAWPPCSPDLNPLHFYLRGHLKSLVYSTPVDDVETLQNQIVAGFEFVIIFGCQWDVKLRPVFRQEVDIWNIYCKVMWRAAMLGGSLVTTTWRMDGGDALQVWRKLKIYWISSRRQPTRGGPPAWRLGVGQTNPHRKK